MAEATLAELLMDSLDAEDESVSDINTIKLTEGGGFRANGCEEVGFERLHEIEGNTGWGAQTFPNLYAYTDERVYFKTYYDGSESINSLPRHPTDETPKAFGGG